MLLKSFDDYTLLQSYIDCTQGWCAANFMTLNIITTRAITFSRKADTFFFKYITRTDCIKDLAVFILNYTFILMLIKFF
jgi:hypothetical protein